MRDERTGSVLLFYYAGPRPFSPPISPRLVLSPALHFVASISSQEGNSRGGVSTSGKAGGRKRAGNPRVLSLFFSTGQTPAFSDPFPRGKARSVARGGWRSECHEWW